MYKFDEVRLRKVWGGARSSCKRLFADAGQMQITTNMLSSAKTLRSYRIMEYECEFNGCWTARLGENN
jgi:hypothetical protein